MRRSALVMGVCLALVIAPAGSSKIICVDDDGLAGGDGKSWATAYRYLQDALADAKAAEKPVEIRVAQGIYKPDQGAGIPAGDRGATFHLINGAAIRGGCAGLSMTDPNVRNAALYQTILSGDLLGNDAPRCDISNLLNESSRADNSLHVVSGSGTDITAVLDGFTISQGNFTPVSDRDPGGGGGMYNSSGSPQVIGCLFMDNAGRDMGGGVYNKNHSEPLFINCIFRRNWAGQGGAVANYRASGSSISNCTLTCNSAGIYSSGDSMPRLTNCIIWGNGRFDEPSQIQGGAVMNYCCIQGWTRLDGNGNMAQDPLFVDPNSGDLHLKSRAGRWNANTQGWILDEVTSPCIDTGDPALPVGREPFPNGGRINLGAYGGTAEASKSYFDQVPCNVVIPGDINGDCKVDAHDLALREERGSSLNC